MNKLKRYSNQDGLMDVVRAEGVARNGVELEGEVEV